MKTFILDSLTNALNAYLSLDSETNQRLLLLEHKVVNLTLMPFELTLQCRFQQQKIHLTLDSSLPANAEIIGTPLSLAGAACNKEDRKTFFANDLQMLGNAEIAEQVLQLFEAVDIDWEEYLSKIVGDIPAYKLGQFVKNLRTSFTQLKRNTKHNIDDFLHEELGWFPNRMVLQDFFDEVDVLRMDVDRIAAKLSLLKDQIERG